MRKRSKWVLVGIGILVVVLGTWYGVALARSTARLREVYAALEKAGRPMNPADVTPAKVPDEQNAAVLYLRAASMLKTQPVREKDLLKYLADLSDAPFKKTDDPDKLARQKQDVAELKQLMAQDVVAQAISVIEQGTQRPACQFVHDYSRDTSLNVPAMEDLRNLIRVMGTKMHFEAEAGQPQKAWARVPTLLRFADAGRDEPGLDNQFSRTGRLNYSCWTIRTLCETASPDIERYKEIDGLLAGFDDVKPIVHATDTERLLVGERVFNLPEDELYEFLRKDRWTGKDATPAPGLRLIFRLTTFKPRFVADHAAYLKLMSINARLLEGPFVRRDSPEYQEIEKSMQWYYITNRLAPIAWGTQWMYCHIATSVRLTRTGLALLQYRQAHGTFPPSLDALDLKNMMDPYTQQPLHYRAEGNGFIVYSVDEDQQDNGGITEPLERRGNRDIVWRFPEPKTK
jgi:hypothetical protein